MVMGRSRRMETLICGVVIIICGGCCVRSLIYVMLSVANKHKQYFKST